MSVKVNKLENSSDEEIQVAQVKLDKLCEDHDIKKFNIASPHGRWESLVLSICGIKIEKPKLPGRRNDFTPEQKEQIVRYIELVDQFPFIDESGNETYRKTTLAEKCEMLSPSLNIEDGKKRTQYSGKEYKVKDKILNFWHNNGRRILNELQEAEDKKRLI